MTRHREEPVINIALPGCAEDRQVYARVCGHVIVQTSQIFSLAEVVGGMTLLSIRLSGRRTIREHVMATFLDVRRTRREDLGYRRMARLPIASLAPQVQVRIPRAILSRFERASDAELAWLHVQRRMSFKEFVKLTMLVSDRLLSQSERAQSVIGKSWPIRA